MTPPDVSTTAVVTQAKMRFKALLIASICVIALMTIIVLMLALAFPESIPSWSQQIHSASLYLLIIRWSLYATILYKFTALCRYLVPEASAEKIAYAKKRIAGLMLFYELIVGAKLLTYFFDFFFNSAASI